jgi:hypothetical protein
MERDLSKNTVVLVVGDWVVDEHWITGQHRTTTSSRTSHDYSRILNHSVSNMRSLCGAGLVASILWSIHDRKQNKISESNGISVYGFGLWHPDDTPILEHMLDPAFTNGMTHHMLSTAAPDKPEIQHLFSLGALSNTDVFVGTTRVIRIYEKHRGQPRLKQRIDWDVPLEAPDFLKLIRRLDEVVDQLPTDVTDIVVKDLGKGVVSPKIIQTIRDRYPNAKWYVSSKIWRPIWMNDLRECNVAFYLIPQVAAQLAMNDASTNVYCWLTPSGVPSKEGLEYLRSQHHKTRVVVLPDNSRLLAYDGEFLGHVQSVKLPSDEAQLTQMASVFLPAVIAHQLCAPRANDFGATLRHALAYTESWRSHDQDRLLLEEWTQQTHSNLLEDYEIEKRKLEWHTFKWNEVSADWEAAFRDRGIIEKNDRVEFHLWRGMTELSGYVSCIPVKRKHIQQLLRDGHRFVDRPARERKHLSYVIVDRPGSGKSYLIDRLASALNMNVLKFNLTQLNGLQDLLMCFEQIRSEQERNRDVPLLLFFDEMNVRLNDSYYFGGFLEPMDDGSYVHDGLAHRLTPCFWIFAGTQFPTAASASTKVIDFESRLARKPMILSGGSENDEGLHRVEKVYMGVAAIRSVFRDVTQVSSDVLWVFRNLKEKLGPRDITRIVRNCENVQYGRVGLAQLPEDIGQYIEGDSAEVDRRRRKPQKFVKIVDEPLNWSGSS